MAHEEDIRLQLAGLAFITHVNKSLSAWLAYPLNCVSPTLLPTTNMLKSEPPVTEKCDCSEERVFKEVILLNGVIRVGPNPI